MRCEERVYLLGDPTPDVLILVLVEYALRDKKVNLHLDCFRSLNPCFSGICAARCTTITYMKQVTCLNPCFSGICAASLVSRKQLNELISLNPCFSGICAASL